MELLLPKLGLFVWTLIAFLIVFFLLKKFAWGPILKMLHERETGIANSIASAEKMKAEMAKMQADNDKQLAIAMEERSAILKEAKEQSDRMIAEAKDKAKVEAQKVIDDASFQVEQQKNKAISEVKEQLAQLTIGVAEKILKKNLSSEDAQAEHIQSLAKEINLN